jgi:hypothetical protein
MPPLEFRPLGSANVTISAVADLTTEQVNLLKAPFVLGEKVKGVATLQTFGVTLDLTGVTLPAAYRVRVYVYTLGSAAIYAPKSHNPVAGRLPKTKLFRLAPDVTGAQADNTNQVMVTVPAALQVGRIVPEVRGLFSP